MNLMLLFALLAGDVETLSANAGVAKVEQVLPGEPAIVHILNWHYVSKTDLAEAEGLEGDELDREYENVMADVAAVHDSMLRILFDQPAVFLEGLTDRNQTIIAAEIRGLVAFHRALKAFEPPHGEATRLILAEHRAALLRLGAAAKLQLDGKPIKMLPAEGDEHEAGKADKLSDETNQAREAAIVKRIVKSGKTATLVLGGGHDLTAAIKPTGWGYIRITPRGYPR